MRNQGYCEVAVERAHTKSLDANDKLIQTRSHVRDKQRVGNGKSECEKVNPLCRETLHINKLVLLLRKFAVPG